MTTLGVVGDSISAKSYVNQYGFTQLSGYYLDTIAAIMRWNLLPNTAVPGLTLHAAVGMLPQLIPIVPNHLIVNLGANDAYRMNDIGGESGTLFQNDWNALWQYVNGLTPKPTVTVIGLLPTLYGFGCPWSWNDPWLIDYIDSIARDTCYRNGGYWIDLRCMTNHLDMIRSDNHPSPYGHATMAGLVLKRWGVA